MGVLMMQFVFKAARERMYLFWETTVSTGELPISDHT
jgi:hypothetical protein